MVLLWRLHWKGTSIVILEKWPILYFGGKILGVQHLTFTNTFCRLSNISLLLKILLLSYLWLHCKYDLKFQILSKKKKKQIAYFLRFMFSLLKVYFFISHYVIYIFFQKDVEKIMKIFLDLQTRNHSWTPSPPSSPHPINHQFLLILSFKYLLNLSGLLHHHFYYFCLHSLLEWLACLLIILPTPILPKQIIFHDV